VKRKCKGCDIEFEQTFPPKVFHNRRCYLNYSKRYSTFTVARSEQTAGEAELARKKRFYQDWKE
jgi:hypothetical protein